MKKVSQDAGWSAKEIQIALTLTRQSSSGKREATTIAKAVFKIGRVEGTGRCARLRKAGGKIRRKRIREGAC